MIRRGGACARPEGGVDFEGASNLERFLQIALDLRNYK